MAWLDNIQESAAAFYIAIFLDKPKILNYDGLTSST